MPFRSTGPRSASCSGSPKPPATIIPDSQKSGLRDIGAGSADIRTANDILLAIERGGAVGFIETAAD